MHQSIAQIKRLSELLPVLRNRWKPFLDDSSQLVFPNLLVPKQDRDNPSSPHG